MTRLHILSTHALKDFVSDSVGSEALQLDVIEKNPKRVNSINLFLDCSSLG